MAFLLTMALACGGSDPAGPGEDPTPSSGPMTARVDGVGWTATSAVVSRGAGQGFIAVSGVVGGNTGIVFAFPDQGAGTYAIPGTVGLNFNFYEYGTGRVWQALGMGTQLGGVGSGSVTVTTLTATRVAGTFSFSAPAAASSGATGTRTVTQGQFDVVY